MRLKLEEHNKTIEDLANHLDIPIEQVESWIDLVPPPQHIARVCDYLGIGLYYLFKKVRYKNVGRKSSDR